MLLAVSEVHAQGQPPGQPPSPLPLWSLLVVVPAALSSGLFLSTTSWWRPNVAATRQPILWGVLVATAGLSAWSYSQLIRATKPFDYLAQDRISLGKLHEIPNVHGETDLGRRVDLLRFEATDDEDLPTIEAAPQRHGGVERAKPSDRSNCHGWIFTAGQHFVSGAMVPRILEDNGYVPVTDPQPGDLVVYWDDHNYVQHTGLVRGKFDDGIVLVESKFGVGSRFLHMPEDQPYSVNFEYYRTSRGGHLITLRSEPNKRFDRPQNRASSQPNPSHSVEVVRRPAQE